MQTPLTLLAALLTSLGAAAGIPADHLQQAKIRYPYSLIGDDHGILSEQDLAMSTCYANPTPFSSTEGMGAFYWKCFETKKISTECDSNGEQDPYEEGLLELTVTDRDESHDYIARRVLPLHDCQQFVRDIRKRLRGSRYACIMGSSPSMDNRPPELIKYTWIFEAIRTRKGCESYFQQCDLNDLIKEGGCEPSPLLGPIRLPPDPNFWILQSRK
jgi:hypothetical protein